MQRKTLLVIMCMITSLGLIAQGKLYITPRVGFHSASYSAVDSINNQQHFFRTRKFEGKDFIAGIALSYINKKMEYTIGLEEGVYASGFYYSGDNSRPDNVVSKNFTSQQCSIIFSELKYDAWGWNVKMPAWIGKTLNTNKPYLIVSRFMPMVGFEYRKLPRGNRFINDYEENFGTNTLNGPIPFSVLYHAYNRKQFSVRAGIDWVFYDGEKRRFLVNLMYSFAFEDAGYFQYRFYPNTSREFHYRNNTRGNGFSLKIGIPIKIFESKK